MSEDSETEQKGSSAGEPSQFEKKIVVKLTIWRLATWDLLSMRIGRARATPTWSALPKRGAPGLAPFR